MDEKHPGGRPSKYKPEYCDLLIEHMDSGMTYTSFAGHPLVRVTRDCLYKWEKEYPEFLYAKEVGRGGNEYFFMEAGIAGLFDKSALNTSQWNIMMKNMHGWKDKQEVEHSGQTQVVQLVHEIDED